MQLATDLNYRFQIIIYRSNCYVNLTITKMLCRKNDKSTKLNRTNGNLSKLKPKEMELKFQLMRIFTEFFGISINLKKFGRNLNKKFS